MEKKYINLKARIKSQIYSSDYRIFVSADNYYCSNYTCFRTKREFEKFKKFMGGFTFVNDRWDNIVYKFQKNIIEKSFYNVEELENNLKKVVMLVNGSKVVSFYKEDEKNIYIFYPNPNSLFYKTHILDYFKNDTFDTEDDKFIYDYKNIANDIRNYDALQKILKRI